MSNLAHYLRRITYFSRNCRLFIVSNTILGFGISSIEVFLGLFFLSMNYREDFIGTYYSISTGTSALFLLLTGRLSDRIGRVASFYLTLFGNMAGYSILLFCDTPAMINLCGFINGASAALRACTSAPFLHENSKPEEREYVFPAASSYQMVGSILGNLIGGLMPVIFKNAGFAAGDPAAYRMAILISVLFMAVSVFPLGRIRTALKPGEVDESVKSPDGAGVRAAFLIPEGAYYHKFVIYTFFIGCGAGLIVPFFNIYFAQKFAMSSAQVGVIFMAANIITAASMMATPAITARLGKIRSIMLMELASLPFLLALGFSTSLPVCLTAYLARNSLMNMNNPVFTGVVMEMTKGSDRGRVNSIVTLGDNVSRTVSTFIAGRIISNHGHSFPYMMTAAFYTIAAFYVYSAFGGYERVRPNAR